MRWPRQRCICPEPDPLGDFGDRPSWWKPDLRWHTQAMPDNPQFATAPGREVDQRGTPGQLLRFASSPTARVIVNAARKAAELTPASLEIWFGNTICRESS